MLTPPPPAQEQEENVVVCRGIRHRSNPGAEITASRTGAILAKMNFKYPDNPNWQKAFQGILASDSLVSVQYIQSRVQNEGCDAFKKRIKQTINPQPT